MVYRHTAPPTRSLASIMTCYVQTAELRGYDGARAQQSLKYLLPAFEKGWAAPALKRRFPGPPGFRAHWCGPSAEPRSLGSLVVFRSGVNSGSLVPAGQGWAAQGPRSCPCPGRGPLAEAGGPGSPQIRGRAALPHLSNPQTKVRRGGEAEGPRRGAAAGPGAPRVPVATRRRQAGARGLDQRVGCGPGSRGLSRPTPGF